MHAAQTRIVPTILIGVLLASGSARAGILEPASGTVIFVSAKGDNKAAGSKEAPLKNIDAAVKKAKSGDTIAVAEGVYMGTFKIGYFEIDKALKLYGGFAPDFSRRDVIKHKTLIQPDNASGAKARKALLRFTKEIDGAVVDGFVFDMGLRNSYHASEGKPAGVETGMLLLAPAKASGENPTVAEPCLSIRSGIKAGDLTVSNNVFANCANFGIQAALMGGTYKVLNNVFVANHMAAIEIFGSCRQTGGPKEMNKCGEVEIANNTILFTWSRLKDFLDMGYGVRVMSKAGYNIHHNIIGGSVLTGVDHSRFDKDEWIKMDRNIFFVNKQGDLHYVPASNTSLNLGPNEFSDLPFASAADNKNEIPKGLSIDQAYLEGFLAARYSEQADYDPDSPANQWRAIMGLNKQGKLKTKVSMFANRYPSTKAVELFGSVAGYGAQKPQ